MATKLFITNSLSCLSFLIYFIFSLFNDATSSAAYTASNEGTIKEYEWERAWKHAVVPVLFRHRL